LNLFLFNMFNILIPEDKPTDTCIIRNLQVNNFPSGTIFSFESPCIRKRANRPNNRVLFFWF
jgi:hypothetical protein